MNEKKKTGVIAIAALMAVLFFAIGSAQAVEVQRFFDNVESGNIGWTVTAGQENLWNINQLHSKSGASSWGYTHVVPPNYNVGDVKGDITSGCIESPGIDLTDATAATLNYWTWWQTETPTSAIYDTKRVEISTDGGTIWILLEQLTGSTGEGDRTLDLGAHVGNVVNIRYCFDTGDHLYNNFEGWFVDDIEVLAEVEGPAPPEGDLEVTKTVWNEKTEEWVDEILCAEQEAVLPFKCVINNTGDTNLTNVRFWDVMTCSLNFIDESAGMLVPGEEWTSIIARGEPNVFKQKLLHSIDYEVGDPVGKSWKQIYPGEVTYMINAWNDTNNDGNLTACDQINVTASVPEGTWYHVDGVTYTLNTTNGTGVTYFDSFDLTYDYANPNITDPDSIVWAKVCPSGCPDLEWSNCTVDYWTDTNGNDVLDSGDVLFMICDDGTAGCHTLTEDVKPDIWVSKEWDVDELNKGAVILHPGENVTVAFYATVVAYGDDYNIQCAKAKNVTGDWIYSNCDQVHIRAPEQRVYLSPVDSNTTYCNCAEVELRIDACDFKSGGIWLGYDNTCVNVTDYTPNTVDFPMTEHEWNWTEAWDWITFATDLQTLTGDYLIGTLSLHCVNLSNCTSDLLLGGEVFDPFGNWKDSVIVEGGTFSCNESHVCGDVNVDGLVDIGDVGDLHNAVTLWMWGDVADPWAGDVNCEHGLEMGDVGLLHNHVQYGDPPYTLNCCPLGP